MEAGEADCVGGMVDCGPFLGVSTTTVAAFVAPAIGLVGKMVRVAIVEPSYGIVRRADVIMMYPLEDRGSAVIVVAGTVPDAGMVTNVGSVPPR